MKIPKEAKRVFKGVIFDVYQWEQEMFDGSKEIFERIKRPDTVQIIATQGDKILIAKEKQPGLDWKYTMFGGRVEKGEQPFEAAKREFLEETGLESKDWEQIAQYEPTIKIDWTVYVYVARNCEKIAEPNLEPGEKIEIYQVDFDEFIKIVISEDFWGKDFALDVLKQMQSPDGLENLKKQIFK